MPIASLYGGFWWGEGVVIIITYILWIPRYHSIENSKYKVQGISKNQAPIIIQHNYYAVSEESMASPYVVKTREKRTGAMEKGSSGEKWTCLSRRCFTLTLRVLLTNSLHIYWALTIWKILWLVLGLKRCHLPSLILKPEKVLPLSPYVPPGLVVLGLSVNLGLLIMSSNASWFTSVPLHCAQ